MAPIPAQSEMAPIPAPRGGFSGAHNLREEGTEPFETLGAIQELEPLKNLEREAAPRGGEEKGDETSEGEFMPELLWEVDENGHAVEDGGDARQSPVRQSDARQSPVRQSSARQSPVSNGRGGGGAGGWGDGESTPTTPACAWPRTQPAAVCPSCGEPRGVSFRRCDPQGKSRLSGQI
ncbi:hypothetical protein T484DRAFT_3258817 [Baffinella frigidus]|nr:hypothetical protein T484DRAFT_3258817 [Cryptophyta sp. CCMP2293]